MGDVESAGQIVSDQFKNVQDYADTAYIAAVSTIDALKGALGDQSIDVTPPVLDAIVVDQSFNVDPVIAETRSYIESQVGALIDDVTDPGDAPEITQYVLPAEPSISWPTVPILTDISIPEFQEGTIREPQTSLPDFILEVPSLENTIKEALSDATKTPLMSDLPVAVSAHDKLKSNIESGGTMLNASVEADIWNRDLERSEQSLQDAVDKVTGQWAKMGFSLPDGLLAGNLLAINNEYMNKRLDRSRDISIKQAELEQVGMFKSLELATGFSNMWFGVLETFKRRAFEVTKLTTDILIEVYKTRVVQFNVQLEAFKADLLAWKTGIEREMIRAEVYKSRIAGLQLIVNIDEARVKIYASHLDAIGQLVKVWDTQIRAVATMYDVEKTRLEAYKTKVEAYSVRIDSATKKYVASMEGVKTLIQGWAASADTKVKLIELKTKANMFESDIEMKQWEIELKTKEQELALRLEALKAAAQTASNVAAGALSAAHASASAGYNAATQFTSYHSYQEK